MTPTPIKTLLLALAIAVAASSQLAAAPADSSLDQATSYFRQAQLAPEPQRQQLQLRAIGILIQAGYTLQAKNALAEMDTRPLPRIDLQRKQLYHARLALIERAPSNALLALQGIGTTAPDEIDLERLRLQTNAYAMLGDNYNELQTRLAMNGRLASNDNEANRIRINQLFAQLNNALSQQGSTLQSEQQAWRQRREQVQQRMNEWRREYPGLDSGMQSDAALDLTSSPQHIAVLLPLSGRFASAGLAVRLGIEAAYQAQGNNKPRLDFLDTREDPAIAAQLYQQAIKAGADFIIGPLTKESVSSIVSRDSRRAPTLALNYLPEDSPAPRQFYQYSLAPEDEATQVAQRAWQDGHRNAMIFSPENSWGQRLAGSFADAWIALGGRIIARHDYPADKTDFSELIRSSLQLPPRSKRKTSEPAPTPRQDVDAIFLVANPRLARLWRPQLQFHRAAQIPVYSTSHAFSGILDERADRDMEGVIIGDMPWVLDRNDEAHPLRPLNTARDELSIRLVAFGIDAYRLAQYLYRDPQGSPPFIGETGALSVSTNQRIQRRLEWAQFQGGLPMPYAPQVVP